MVVIGFPLRYQKSDDDRSILYISERIRRTFQKAEAYILPIAPVQDVDYMKTRGNEFLELTDKEKDIIDFSLSLVDGIVFPGGIKITPYDRYLLERCIELKIPVLGICLGMQLLSCYKEKIEIDKNKTELNHNQESDFGFCHKVKISKNSKLYEILNKEEIEVNSFHQYHGTHNSYYKISAVSEDGLIEAVELEGDVFNIGVQWHPEISYDFDENSRKIIYAFMNAAISKKNQKVVEKECV